MSITCCKNCMERYPGCHSRCEDYLEQKDKLNHEKDLRRHVRKLCEEETSRSSEGRDINLSYYRKH